MREAKRQNRAGKWVLFAGLFLLVPGLLIAAFECAAYDVRFHIALHDSLGSAEAADMTRAEMVAASEALIAYLRGGIDELPALYTLSGKPLFGDTMNMHMADVRALFDLAATVRLAALAAGAALALMGCVLSKKRWKQSIQTEGLISIGLWALLLGAAAVYAAIDFNALFTRFHELFFTNELWLLDPATDPIILMLSERFFLEVAARAAIYMLCAIALFAALICLPRIFANRRMNRAK